MPIGMFVARSTVVTKLSLKFPEHELILVSKLKSFLNHWPKSIKTEITCNLVAVQEMITLLQLIMQKYYQLVMPTYIGL